jgi:hypothetical protein
LSEVGALIIKLQAETAQFREDMGKVKSDLKDLGGSAGQAGDAMDYSMLKARGALMIVESEAGVHLPRALNTLIATIPGVGAAFEAMLPLIGIVAAVALIDKLIERQKDLAEKAHKLAVSQVEFGTTAQEAFNKISAKMLEVGIKADELRGDHLAALKKQLVLIDHQSMQELAQEFDSLAAAADKTLSNISEHWYESKIGVVGVRDALDTFKAQYTQLLELHKDKEAGDLLAGTLASAIKAKELMEASQGGHGSTQSDLDAQNALIGLLTTEVSLRRQSAQLTAAEKKEATNSAIKQTITDTTQRQKELNALVLKGMEDYVAFGRVQREAYKGSNSNESLSQVEDFIKAIAEARKKASQEELASATQGFANRAELAKASSDQEKGAIANAVEGGLITRKRAVQEEIALVQQEFGVRMTALAQEVAAKRAAVQAEIDADNRAASQTLAANGGDKADPRYIQYLSDAATKVAQLDTITNKYNADVKSLTTTQQTQIAGLNIQVQKLGADWKIYFAQMKSETSDLATTINTTLQGSMTKFTDGFAQGIAKTIVEGKNLGKEMKGVARDILEGMIQTLVKWVAQWIVSHTIMAAVGNSSALQQVATQKVLAAQLAGANAVASFSAAPWPIDTGAPAFGASMMAAAMSFEIGGKIPGAGAVPIIGHGGETVVTKALTDRVESAERGGSGSGMHMHATFAPHIHAVDAEGVDRMLEKHGAVFHRHIASTLRKMNK